MSPETTPPSALTAIPVFERRESRRRRARQKIESHMATLSSIRAVSVVFIVFALGCVGLFGYSTIENGALIGSMTFENVTEYGMVVDAGSHGSRLHIYSWPSRIHDREHPLTGPITYPEEVAVFEQSPGISSMADTPDPDAAGEQCISPLLKKAENFLQGKGVKKERWPEFPIFVKATAGMRNLDALSRSRLMTSIREYLANTTLSPFMFRWNWARIVAGEEEGVYGWLTVNNALGTTLLSAEQTLGALDMGGASMQITFSPVHTSVLEDYYGLVLAGQTLRLYSHSFLGYGWSDSLNRLTTKLAVELIANSWINHEPRYENVTRHHASNDEVSIMDGEDAAVEELLYINATHPCYPKGHDMTFVMPSLVYPEGRFYVDVNPDLLETYMKSLGIPGEYIARITSKYGLAQHGLSTTPLHDGMSRPHASDVNTTVAAQTLEKPRRFSVPYGKPFHPIFLSHEPPLSDDDDSDHENTDHTEGHATTGVSYQHSSRRPSVRAAKNANDNGNNVKRPRRRHRPFQPLDAPLPLDAAPKRLWALRFSGTSDFAACRARARELFYNEPCFIHSCSFNGAYQPRLEDSRFVAFGQYSKVRVALNVPENAPLATIEERAREVCAHTMQELHEARKRDPVVSAVFGKKALSKLCWKSIWAHTTLEWGYGFSSNKSAVQFTAPASATTLKRTATDIAASGWAAGSMFFEVNGFPWKTPDAHYQWPFLWGLLSVSVLVILVGLNVAQLYRYAHVLRIAGLTPHAKSRWDLSHMLTSPLLSDGSGESFHA